MPRYGGAISLPCLIRQVLFAKGAPEMLVKRCTKIMMPDGSVEEMTEQWRGQIETELDRSLGLARDRGTGGMMSMI